MSEINTRDWLLSYKNKLQNLEFNMHQKCTTIAIASGKGGVGKTSVSLKFAQLFSKKKLRVLLIDCDFNLTNTSVKLGLSLNNNFIDYLNRKRDLKDCIEHIDGFDLLSSCSGEIDVVHNQNLSIEIINIIRSLESEYDYILLDCPAGISKDTLNIFAYADEHIVVMTPDRSSITDSYSLVKIAHNEFMVKNISLLVNKVSSLKQYKKVATVFINTVEKFLKCSIKLMGSISYDPVSLDQFDQLLVKCADSNLHQEFSKIVNSYAEKLRGDTESVHSISLHRNQFQRQFVEVENSLS